MIDLSFAGYGFAHDWVWLLLPLPFLVYFFFPARMRANQALEFPFSEPIQESKISKKRQTNYFRWLIMLAIWILLLAATARPQIIGESIHAPVTGRSLLMAVDVSGSMETRDMVYSGRIMNRMRAVKVVGSDFISKRTGDRIGLILFGTQAYLQTPLTFDRETVKTFLEESSIGIAGRDTAIGDAIGLSIKRLQEIDEKNRVLILLTDGENTTGNIDPLKAADLAAQKQVKIYTIGIGANARQVQTPFGFQMSRGSSLDETTLKAIADKTNGKYFRAHDVKSLIDIYKQLDEIEPVSNDELTYRNVEEFYHYPLLLAILLTLVFCLFLILKLLLKRIFETKSQSNVKAGAK